MCASDFRHLRVVTAMNEMNDTTQHGLQACCCCGDCAAAAHGEGEGRGGGGGERHESTLSLRFFLGSVSWLLDPSSRQLGGL